LEPQAFSEVLLPAALLPTAKHHPARVAAAASRMQACNADAKLQSPSRPLPPLLHPTFELMRAMLLDAQSKEQGAPASPYRETCGAMSVEDAEDKARRAGHIRKRELECQDPGLKEELPAGCKHCARCHRVIRGPGKARHRPHSMAHRLALHRNTCSECPAQAPHGCLNSVVCLQVCTGCHAAMQTSDSDSMAMPAPHRMQVR